MKTLEVCLTALLLMLCTYTTVTDFRSGIIGNRPLLCAASVGLGLNVAYYAVFARSFLTGYLINLLVLSALSILFYACHFWAAGDSKLLVLVAFLLPARLFGWESNGIFPGINLLIFTFSAAFFYLIVESLVLHIKDKDSFSLKGVREGLWRFIKSYVFYGTYLSLLNQAGILLLPGLYREYGELFMLGSFFVAIFISNLKWLKKPGIFLPCLLVAVGSALYLLYTHRMSVSPFVWAALFVVALIRILAEKYNYETISTESIGRGMVLSAPSAVAVNMAGVLDYPLPLAEDVRGRLDETAAGRIRKWGRSRTGSCELVIVRRMPFAVFISVGTLLFIMLRVWGMCSSI